MLNSVFHWFYCLPILEVVVLIVMALLLFGALRRRFQASRFWRSCVRLCLVGWLLVIVFGTVGVRSAEETALAPSFVPFHSYRAVLTGENIEILRANFMNVVLFLPAGLLLCECVPSLRKGRRIVLAVVGPCILSVLIELCQYRFALGQAEMDDVIHNTLGAGFGVLAASIDFRQFGTWLQKRRSKK